MFLAAFWIGWTKCLRDVYIPKFEIWAEFSVVAPTPYPCTNGVEFGVDALPEAHSCTPIFTHR